MHLYFCSFYMPAGIASPGETPEEATLREAIEEAGIDVELTGILRVRYEPHPGRGRTMLQNKLLDYLKLPRVCSCWSEEKFSAVIEISLSSSLPSFANLHRATMHWSAETRLSRVYCLFWSFRVVLPVWKMAPCKTLLTCCDSDRRWQPTCTWLGLFFRLTSFVKLTDSWMRVTDPLLMWLLLPRKMIILEWVGWCRNIERLHVSPA